MADMEHPRRPKGIHPQSHTFSRRWGAHRGIIIDTMASAARFLQSFKLPVMPEAAQALIRTLSNEQADVPLVVAIIAKDPALTTTLLRMANSAMFGLSRSVNTLESAVSVVGMAHIRARALSICMAGTLEFPPSLDRLAFWSHCLVCAGYAKWLAASIAMDEQQAWLTGMMVRLGQIVIAQRMPIAMEEIELLPRAPGERWKRERALAGFDEGEIAAEIARRWDFPEMVALGLQAAGQPLANRSSPLGAVVHLAGLVTDQAMQGAIALKELPLSVVQMLGLPLERLQESIPKPETFSDISMLQS